MARKSGTSRRSESGIHEWPARCLAVLGIESPSQLVRPTAWLSLAVALAVSIHFGFLHMEKFVHAQERYARSLTLQWVDLPDWLQLPTNRHILETLTRTVGLRERDRLLDAALAQRLGQALAAPDVGWVKSVDRVRIEPTGVVSVKCRFRRPAAWVHHGPHGYLVDDEGCRLPGRYDLDDCKTTSLLLIEGVESEPPAVGGFWPGADLRAGLKLALLLGDKPFRHQITSIIVANHDGRRDRSRPFIELATDRRNSRIWWGRPPEEDYGTEISAAQKITLLQTLYRQWGRVDMNRSYVNITTWPDRVALPAAGAAAQSRLLRG